MVSDPVIVTSAISSHQHYDLRFWIVTNGTQHVYLQTLIKTLLSAGELPPFKEFRLHSSGLF